MRYWCFQTRNVCIIAHINQLLSLTFDLKDGALLICAGFGSMLSCELTIGEKDAQLVKHEHVSQERL